MDGFAATGKIYAADAELVLLNATAQATLDIISSFSTGNFLVAENANGGTDITICYLPGTRILTRTGERFVEALERGDLVPTRFSGFRPIKWIGRQSYASRFLSADRLPVRIAPGALGPNAPAEALYVSAGHSMLVGDLLVLARNLVNGITITQPQVPNTVQYYAIELDVHDCVLANHAWGETFADGPGLRAQFHNAAEFYAFFPDYVEPEAISLCAPRPEDGPELAEALALIVARAAAVTQPGALRGCIDEVSPAGIIRGWAWDEANPALPVLLEVNLLGRCLGTVLANRFREDLRAAGMGQGSCAFQFIAPLGLPVEAVNHLQIRRRQDGAAIVPGPHCLAA